jgi:hypothetical protein
MNERKRAERIVEAHVDLVAKIRASKVREKRHRENAESERGIEFRIRVRRLVERPSTS